MINTIILFVNTAIASDDVYSTKINMHKNEYTNNVRWINPPDVIICKNQTVFNEKHVEFAVSKWDKKIGKIYTVDTCDYSIERGSIKIIDAKKIDRNSKWGETEYYFYREYSKNSIEHKVYTGAIVQLDKNVKNVELLVHELGHAFGYKHFNSSHDVMNSVKIY